MISDFLDNPIEVFPKADVGVIKETLSRMGVMAKNKQVLYPSCYLLGDNGKWFIVHFKEIFRLIKRNESYDNLSEDDIKRKKSIIFCLKSWKLIDVNDEDIKEHNIFIDVLPHNHNYEIKHKIRVNSIDNIANTLNVIEDLL